MYATTKFTDQLLTLYQTFSKEIFEIAKEHNISKIQLAHHTPLFEDINLHIIIEDEANMMFVEVELTEIIFQEGNYIVLVGETEDGNIKSAYLDNFWGDFCQVGHIFPLVYRIVTTVLNEKDLKPIEML